MKQSFRGTITAAYIGYIVQALVNTFPPLLYITFSREFSIGMEQIALLAAFNFIVQLLIDVASAFLLDKVGYRRAAVAGHLAAAVGLAGLAFFPGMMPPYWGLMLAIFCSASGSGLIEVIVSPLVEACPSRHKGAQMSLLHSFYCWGYVLTVLGTTAFFLLFSTVSWRVITVLWALIPLVNSVLFLFVPIRQLQAAKEQKASFRTPVFAALLVVMMAAGASEMGMSQWASAFAEAGLGVNKAVGDLAGPCTFAVLMGLARVFYSRVGGRISAQLVLTVSACICAAGYLLAALAPVPWLGLAGCCLCGLGVGVLWPGTLSLASSMLRGGTAMFSLLALAGDAGCTVGPLLVGLASGSQAGGLKYGLLAALVFPLMLLAAMALLRKKGGKNGASVL